MKKIFGRIPFFLAAAATGFIIFVMLGDKLVLPEKYHMTVETGRKIASNTDTASWKSGDKDEPGTDADNTASGILMLVNREHHLEPDFIPDDLIKVDIPFTTNVTDEEKTMRKEAAAALEGLFKRAEEDGIELCGVSGYRSYEYQKEIYNEKLKSKGKAYVEAYVALPGQSEHQTGLAMDVGGYIPLNESNNFDFGRTKEGKWLSENAHNYGFILRYPKGMEKLTGYNYEPWHIRYVGSKAADTIEEKKLVLEEFDMLQ